MSKKFLNVSSLALLQIILVANLQLLPANAVYGFSLPFFYLIGAIGFFIPCILMTAELATTRPQTGGAYIWCEQAFGKKLGFFTIAILWFSNVLWYPSIFSLIATNAAYLYDPALAQNKIFIISFALIAFWFITGLNCTGVKLSSRFSCWSAIIGTILPILFIIMGGALWIYTGKPLAISTNQTPLLPDVKHLGNLGLLIAVAISLAGVELTAVHAGNVVNPRRDYPKSLFVSGIIILALLICSELSIAIIVPSEKLSVVSGLLDALQIFLQSMQWQHFVVPILFLVFIGNLGSIAAWMLGSTRGMFVGSLKNHTAAFLQKTNKKDAPVGVLIFEAIIFTLGSLLFLVFPRITDTFWLILDVASQISLLYYVILFCAAIRLRFLPAEQNGFIVPGGNSVWCVLMGLGICTSLFSFMMGFIPPSDLSTHEISLFHIFMLIGLGTVICLPWILLRLKAK